MVLPATHDTGSAFLAVPAEDDNAVYLSSGTWSLLGVENPEPITSEASRLQNFTNEGGAWYRYRYLKNIMGLWMIQSIRRELNGVDYVEGKTRAEWTLDVAAGERQWTFPDLIASAEGAADFESIVDANDDAFLAPDSMIAAVQKACEGLPSGWLVSVGGNVCGTGPKPDGSAWVVGIQNPDGELNDYQLSIDLDEGSIVSSGDYQRYYTVDGVRYCHIIDPFTGRPKSLGIAACTLAGGTAAGDDALTTALLVMGESRAVKFINEHLKNYRVAMIVRDASGACSRIISNVGGLSCNPVYQLGNTLDGSGNIVLN